jgi:CheY-like chemotaxis protein
MQRLILVVDDDNDDVLLFREAIKEIDGSCDCMIASNGEEALKVLEVSDRRPDIIFMDLNMPRMNGKQCLVELKKNPDLAEIPITIYSTSKLEREIQEIYHLGATSFFTKPSNFNELVEAIAHTLSSNTAIA